MILRIIIFLICVLSSEKHAISQSSKSSVLGKYAVILNIFPNDTIGFLNIYEDSTYSYESTKKVDYVDCELKGIPYFFCFTKGKYSVSEDNAWIDFKSDGEVAFYPLKEAISRKFLIQVNNNSLKYTASKSFQAYNIIKIT